ncbi:MAG: hypothetical protein AAF799_11520 [Myxococcota bacterium]
MLQKIAVIVTLALLLPTGCDDKKPATAEGKAKSESKGKTEDTTKADPEALKREARLLLRAYLEIMAQVAKNGTAAPMLPVLDELAGRAEKLSTGLPATATRIERLLDVTKAIISPMEPGKEAEVQALLTKFVHDTLGPDTAVPAGGGLAAIIPAISEEVISLYQSLDGTSDREATIARYLRPLGIDPDRR